MKKTLLLLIAFMATLSGFAATNLTSGKTVVPLGGLKSYNNGTTDYTISNDDLQKITVDGNTANVYLFPEGGYATDANIAIGIQGFYIDLGEAKSIGAIKSTWEGADCGANIYVTNTEPAADGSLTGETLIATFTNAQEGAKDAAVAVENSGRYLVFVPTEATNYAWGVKIRTFVALEKETSVLTKLLVSPSTVKVGEATEMTFTPQDQMGLTLEGVTYTATNATLEGNMLTATAAGDVVITATLNEVSVQATIKAIAVSDPTTNPTEPTDLAANVIAVYSAKYDKGINESNPGWGVGGGAPNPFYTKVEEVEIADGHKSVHVLGTGFNSRTAGGVGITTDYTKIHVAVYPFTATEAKLFGDNAYGNAVSVDGLVPGQWNYIEVDNAVNWPSYVLIELVGETEFYLDHFYFAKPAVDDTQAPELNKAELVKAGIGTITLTLQATDDKSANVTYIITDQNANKYITKGDSGAEITYTVGGLDFNASYTLTVVAQDDNENVSASQQVEATTLALIAPDAPTQAADKVMSVYSNAYEPATTYNYGGWGQATEVATETVGEDELLKLTKYNYLGFEYATQLDLSGMEYVHIDILPMQPMQVGITPILASGSPIENSTSVGDLTVGEWNSIDLPLSAFDLDFANNLSHQLKIDKGTAVETVYVDNIYFWKGEPAPAEDKTIYLDPAIWNVENVEEAYAVYAFKGEENIWIGMSQVDDTQYFTATVPGKWENIILVRLEAGKELNWDNAWNQTQDITMADVANNTLFTITSWDGDGGKSAYTTGSYPPPTPTTFTVKFKNTIGWENVYAYTFNPETLGDWPGKPMTLVDGVYTISFDGVTAPEYIIFNNGKNDPDKEQTEDLVFENDKEYDLVPPATSGEGSYTIPSGLNEGKELKYTWEFTQDGMDVTITFECTNKDEIIGIVEGYVFDKTDGFAEIAGLSYTWTNCTEGQVIKAAHKWMFAEGDFVTPDFTYTVVEKTPTAISIQRANQADAVYFDLQGRRVAQPTKGLYILNGRKVVIK